MRIEGVSAVVTGAAGGIGEAVARRLLERGAASVVLADVDGKRLDATASALAEELGDRVHSRSVDVTSELGVQAMLEAAPSPVDLFVANAGVFRGFGLESTPEEWAASWDVNVMAHVEAARALVPAWVEASADGKGGGCFVSVASAAGLLTQLGSPTYSATKHAAVGFAEWLAATYGDRGVQVCCVCPMGVRTSMLEAGEGSDDADAALGMRAVTTAGAALEPTDVADVTLDAVESGRFLALPHTEVGLMFERKAGDHDHWITGMQRFRSSLEQPR